MSSIQSVERALDILRCLSGGSAGVSEVADRTGLPKSTVSRMLSTLSELGAVEQIGVGGDYRIGQVMVQIASGATRQLGVVEAAMAHLEELVGATGETAGVSVLDGTDALYLAQHAADTMVQIRDWTGQRVPAHVTSSGLVLMAFRNVAPVAPLSSFTARSVTDPSVLAQRLQGIRDRGVEWTVGEYLADLSSVAAPVRDRGGEVVAALHVHGPTYRFPGEVDVADIEDIITSTAERVSRRLIEGGMA